jgi:hypothetical protein
MEERKEQRPAYEAPQVITYTEEEILEELGPAQAMVYGPIPGPNP